MMWDPIPVGLDSSHWPSDNTVRTHEHYSQGQDSSHSLTNAGTRRRLSHQMVHPTSFLRTRTGIVKHAASNSIGRNLPHCPGR